MKSRKDQIIIDVILNINKKKQKTATIPMNKIFKTTNKKRIKLPKQYTNVKTKKGMVFE